MRHVKACNCEHCRAVYEPFYRPAIATVVASCERAQLPKEHHDTDR